jgi:general secretion pathway protein B
MSFILDALKKSENERRQQQASDFATVPSSHASPPAPRWLWMLGVLLAINIVVIAALLLMRTGASPGPGPTASDPTGAVTAGSVQTGSVQTASQPSAEPVVTAPRGADTSGEASRADGDEAAFANRLAAARREQPLPPAEPVHRGEAAATASPAPDGRRAAPVGMATVPSLEELRLKGSVNLPALHIDLHVYNESPSRRFVSINMNKYRENERLTEGPVLREITPEGVVLEYEGKAFALLQ